LGTALLAGALALGAGAALAQQDPEPQQPRAAQAVQSKAAAGEAGDAVGSRLGRLEQQFNDLQVMVGTLESLVKSKPDTVLPQESAQGQGGSGAAQGDIGSRVAALETQISALTSQLEEMTQQLSALEAKLSGAPRPLPPPGGGAPGRQGAASPQAPDTAVADAGGQGGEPPAFGTTSVSPAADDEPPAQKGESQASSPQAPSPQGTAPQPAEAEPLPPLKAAAPSGPAREDQPQSLAAATPGGNATSLYNQGYGDLLQRDYGAAESAFAQVVHAYPDDPLAGKAQYWLGETYYVRGQYKNAADAFLKGYKKYKSGEKAPDSLLKLGMALAELGQKDAACSTLKELGTKYPAAPGYLRDQGNSEWRKAGC
jgi:tol-pal system protein YbgF